MIRGTTLVDIHSCPTSLFDNGNIQNTFIRGGNPQGPSVSSRVNHNNKMIKCLQSTAFFPVDHLFILLRSSFDAHLFN